MYFRCSCSVTLCFDSTADLSFLIVLTITPRKRDIFLKTKYNIFSLDIFKTLLKNNLRIQSIIIKFNIIC